MGNFLETTVFPNNAQFSHLKVGTFLEKATNRMNVGFVLFFFLFLCNKISLDCFQVPATPKLENMQ